MYTFINVENACRDKTVADIARSAQNDKLYAWLVRIAENAGLEPTDRANVLPLYCSYRLSDSARQRLADEVSRLSKRWRDLGGLTVDNSCFPHWEEAACNRVYDGSQPYVEISCHDSVSGHTELINFGYDDIVLDYVADWPFPLGGLFLRENTSEGMK